MFVERKPGTSGFGMNDGLLFKKAPVNKEATRDFLSERQGAMSISYPPEWLRMKIHSSPWWVREGDENEREHAPWCCKQDTSLEQEELDGESFYVWQTVRTIT